MELMKCFLAFVFSSCMIRTVVESQSVSVDPQVTAYLGGEVTLRCQFIKGGSAANATQVEWRKESSCLAVFNPQRGMSYSKSSGGRVRFTSSSVDDASISIVNINETDAGKYTCTYTTFPWGSKEATTTLTVKVKPWEHSTAVASGIVTALLLIVLIAAALCFIMMKRRQRCDAAPQSRSSRSSSRRATRVTGREEEDVTYADMRGFRPAQGGSAIRTSRERTEYAEVKRSVEGCEEVIYAQVNKR